MWIFEAQRSLCNCLYCWQFIQQQECFFSVWQQASQNVGSVSSGPSDTVLVRSAEVRTSSSYQDSSGSISSVEGRSSHPETKNCSSPEPERRLCFHISLVVILGTSWYRFFFCWEKTSNRRRRKKIKITDVCRRKHDRVGHGYVEFSVPSCKWCNHIQSLTSPWRCTTRG